MENTSKDEPNKNSNDTNSIENASIASVVEAVLKRRYKQVTTLAKSGAIKICGATLLWILGYFNFSWLWIAISVGVFLYMTEARKRKATSSMIAKRANDNPKELVQAMTEVYRMNAKDLPSWIYYPDVEKAEWVNNILQKLWPFIGDFASNLLRTEVQESIRRSSPLLSEFTFTDVDLGQTAPRVAGIKVHGDEHTRRDEIIIDMQIIYEGDSDFGVKVSILEAGVRDFKLRGLMRIELKPLVNTLPLVGAVSVSFVKDPTIDFDLTELANLLDLPGFSGILRGAIADSIGALFVLPEKYIVKLSPNIDISRLRFPLPKGLIRIHIIEAENLAEKDTKIFGLGGKSDPFVMVKVGHQDKFKTKTIDSTVNPKWNEKFDTLIRDVEYGNITFDVYDDDGALAKDDFLGRVTISVKKVYERGIINEKIKLMDTDTGKLSVRLEWFELSADREFAEKTFKETNGTSNCAFLNIYVEGAKDLPNKPEDSYDPSPYLKITTPSGNTLRTKTISDNNNPLWEENFRVLLKDPFNDRFKLEVIDDGCCSDPAVLGDMTLDVKSLLSAADLMVDRSFTLSNSVTNAVLKLRVTLRALELRNLSDATSNEDVFTVTSGPRLAAARAEKERTESIAPNHSRSELSRNNSNSSASSESSYAMDSPTEGNSFALDNLRKRLNAKKNDISPEGNSDANLGRIRLTIQYRSNALVVVVHNAENLIICDEDNKTSDPYVKVTLNKNYRKKTKVVKSNLNPTFEQQLQFNVSLEDIARSKLNVTVKNQTGFLSFEKTLMGEVVIDMAELDLAQPTTKWYNLQLPEQD